MIPLEQIQVASPCSASWAEMEGTEQVRFCRSCEKNVFNLSAMTRDEAEALVTGMEGRLCVRFYRRADGTLLTRDCPVGQRAARFRLAKKRSYAAALLLACGAGLLSGTANAAAVSKHHAHASHARVKPSMASMRLSQSKTVKDKPRVFVLGGVPTLPAPPPLEVPLSLPPPMPPPPLPPPPMPTPPSLR